MATVKHARIEQAALVVPTDDTKPPAVLVALSDGEGNLGAGGAAQTLQVIASAAQAPSSSGVTLVTTGVEALSIDINVTAFTGGTAPTITFVGERVGTDGVWYRVWQSAAVNAAGTVKATIGHNVPTVAAGVNVAQGVTAGLTTGFRLGWSSTGSPTSVTFSASVVGR
jgi:hypothetical protein